MTDYLNKNPHEVKNASYYRRELKKAQERIKELEKNQRSSWEGEVDRQGGSFSQDEIDNANAWR